MMMGETNSPYRQLEAVFRRLNALNGASGILSWDRQTMMPEGGAAGRADQVAELALISHEIISADKVGGLLDAAGEEPLDAWQSANLKEMARIRVHAAACPGDLVEALSRAASKCESLWLEARKDGDFSAVETALADLVELTKQEAAAKSDALGVGLYDALLDRYEPGGRSENIDRIFASLKSWLPETIEEILAVQTRREARDLPPPPYPVQDQEALGRQMMAKLGFDFNRGRLDVSAHPFCGGGHNDVRITTRYDEASFTNSLMGVIHETGHALYELGLPDDWANLPVGHARGMALHESQSLFWEMQIARSPAFVEVLAPMIAVVFGSEKGNWSTEALLAELTRVERGLIRVDADEATYPLHIMLRYDLERALLSGDLAVKDLPVAWSDGFTALFGFPPPNDREGCMQDIHWFDGAIGYFPTYTLGALAAAQFFEAAADALPTIEEDIRTGSFSAIRTWLGENVHSVASSKSTDEIMVSATGSALSDAAFRRHIARRYLS